MRNQLLFAVAVCLASTLTAQTPTTTPDLELPAVPEAPALSRPLLSRTPIADQLRNVTTDTNPSGNVGEIIWDSPSTSFVLRTIGSTTPITFETNGTERMRVFDSGKLAIGSTTAGSGQLSIFSTADGGTALYLSQYSTIEANTGQLDYGLTVDNRVDIASGVTNSAASGGAIIQSWNYGPGTATAVMGVRALTGYKNSSVAGTVTTAYGILVQVEKNAGTITTGYGLFLQDVQATTGYGVYQNGSNDVNYFSGSVGIGTNTPDSGKKVHIVGDVKVAGNLTATSVIGATYQDLAEWVPATHDLTPGTVVVLNTEKSNEVMASSREYDTAVAGVVSAQPGIILGEASETKEQIATTGRVRVRVDASFGAIKVGDLLVTSNIPGTAMKSQPVDVAGRKMHQPGTIIGKALEPLASGSGEILVLLSMQ